jgi:hypothetical protein
MIGLTDMKVTQASCDDKKENKKKWEGRVVGNQQSANLLSFQVVKDEWQNE